MAIESNEASPQTLAQTLAQTGIYQLAAYSKHERQGGPGLLSWWLIISRSARAGRAGRRGFAILVAGCLMLDSKKGKASLFNPVSSDQYLPTRRDQSSQTTYATKLDSFVKFWPNEDE